MLEVEKIDVFHGRLQAIWGVSIQVSDGDLVSLVGSNGAGKTTIVETISSLNSPAQGSVTFNGVRLDKRPAHEVVSLGVCLIPEERGIFPGMSVLENLELGAFTPETRRHRNGTFPFVYDLFPVLKARGTQRAGTLSGGEQQMLTIARSLMGNPELLLLDELTTGLAPIVVELLRDQVKRLKESNFTILLTEQNALFALDMSDRVYVMDKGAIVYGGGVEDLLENRGLMSEYLGVSE